MDTKERVIEHRILEAIDAYTRATSKHPALVVFSLAALDNPAVTSIIRRRSNMFNGRRIYYGIEVMFTAATEEPRIIIGGPECRHHLSSTDIQLSVFTPVQVPGQE